MFERLNLRYYTIINILLWTQNYIIFLLQSVLGQFLDYSHHLSVHGDDVSNERAVLHGAHMSVGNPIDQRRLWAAGQQCAGPTVSDQVTVSS